MTTIWSLFFTFCWYLPWVAIALMGGLALRRRESPGLLMQAGAASGLFLLGIGRWVVLWVLRLAGAPLGATNAAGTIFDFLLFMALVIFALGYCVERFRRQGAVEVTATRVG